MEISWDLRCITEGTVPFDQKNALVLGRRIHVEEKGQDQNVAAT